MNLKMLVTAAAVTMVSGVMCGCSAVPPALQGQNAYGSAGRVASARPGFAASSPTVVSPSGHVIGADPDVNVRFDLHRDAGLHEGAN